MEPSIFYAYKANVIRVIDGDTAELNIDLGFKLWLKRSARLTGINTPELNSSDPVERTLAQKARDALKALIEGKDVTVISHSLDKYGRPLVSITSAGVNVNQYMIQQGYAVIMLGNAAEKEI